MEKYLQKWYLSIDADNDNDNDGDERKKINKCSS